MKYILIVILSLFGASGSFSQSFTPALIRKHIEFLASDDLEGRGTASLGEIRAANYIAEAFKIAGLKPA